MKSDSTLNSEQQLREMNEALLISSVHQHELTEQAQKAEAAMVESERRIRAEADALAKLNELSSRLWRARTLRDGLDEMLAATIELLGADMGHVQLLDARRGALLIDAQRGFKQDFLDFFRAVSTDDDPACGRALRSGERIIVEDVETDPLFAPARHLAAAAGFRAVQSTPLIGRDGIPLGMLSTHFRSVHRPNEQALRRLDLYVRQAVDFIERKRIEEALRKSQQELAAELEATQRLQQVSSHMASAGDSGALYENIMDAAVAIMRSDFASMQMFYPERGTGGELLLLGNRGFTPEAARAWEWIAADHATTCGMAFRTGTRSIVPDVETCDWMAGTKDLLAYRQTGIRSMQSTPLYSRGGAKVGMISTHWRQPHEPSDRDLRLFDILARQAADLIERTQAEQALRTSEERYRTLFEAMDEGYCIIEVLFDAQGQPHDYRFIEVNGSFERQAGMHDVIGKRMLEFVPAIESHWLKNYGRVALTGEPIRFSGEYKGLHRSFDVYAFRPAGWPERHVAVLFADITNRKQAEQATARLAAIVTSSEDAIISKDLDGIITSWNKGAQHLFGYTSEEIVGKPVTILIPPEHLDEEPQILGRIRRGEAVEHYETVRQRKDGKPVNVSLTISPVKDHSGRIIGASKIARDITDRKRAEHALRESEERFRLLADSAPALIWINGPAGAEFVNRTYLNFLGAGDVDVRGFNWAQFIHPDDRDDYVSAYLRAVEQRATFDAEFRFRRHDREYRWMQSIGQPRLGANGELLGYAGITADITDRKQAEAALDQAREDAEAANRAKDLFLATLSHEIRTPLSAIVGWMQILQGGREGGASDAELDEGLEVIERNARTMVQLLDDVMDVSRIISGKVRLEVRPCELSAVIRAGIDVVRTAASAKDIAISVEHDPAASAASCDAARMQQVVWNLLSNAIKFTPKGGKVHITLARDGADVRIQVSDSGQGIAPELLPYVFDRFRQADSSTRRRFGGLGLGLSIVKHLVELHGGTVQVHSEGDGHGSTFTVLLPIRAVRTDECGEDSEADDSERLAPTALPLVPLDGLRVLVVDDEPDARRLLAKVLQQAGAIVTAAASAAEAIEALTETNPDVLVSDLGMADQDGYDLIRQVRASGRRAKDLPAVALTAFVRKQDQRQALLAGFQMHIPKPADPHDLTAVISSLAGRTGPAP